MPICSLDSNFRNLTETVILLEVVSKGRILSAMLKPLGGPLSNQSGIVETGTPMSQRMAPEARVASLRDMVESVRWERGVGARCSESEALKTNVSRDRDRDPHGSFSVIESPMIKVRMVQNF